MDKHNDVAEDGSSINLVSEPITESPTKQESAELPEESGEYVVVEKTASIDVAQSETQSKSEEVEDLPNDVDALKALVRDLKKQVATLEQEIATLKTRKTAAIPPVSGATRLTPLTKGRVMKPGVVSKMKSNTPSESSQHESDETPKSASTNSIQEDPVPEVDPAVAEEQRKKRLIAQMGGVNPLVGMNPAAFLKTRSSLGHGSNHEESSSPTSRNSITASQEVNEVEIKDWISKKVGNDIQGEWKDVLRDGTVLCKLINALRPDNTVKINTGRFSFMHMENINNYLKAAAAMGVPKQQTFNATDLYDGSDINKVLQNLSALQKLTSN